MDSLVSDLRFAARTLAARPAFTLVAVLTLALGIGANAGVFSVVDALLLRPLPYRDPERLVWVKSTLPDVGLELTAGADYLEWRNAHSLESVGAFTDEHFTHLGVDSPERLEGAQVSASLLPLFGVRPAQGRGIEPPDERLHAAPVAVVSDRLWRRLFGPDARLSGQVLKLDSLTCDVVGVLPHGFVFPGHPDADVLVALILDEAVERSRQRMTIVNVIGRLAPAVTLKQARAELATIQKRSVEAAERQHPGPDGPPPGAPELGGGRMQIRGAGPGPGGGRPQRSSMPLPKLELTTLSEHLVGDVRPALLLLLGAVGLVLLIACANVANLLLARAAGRRREIAVRAALGAGRRRIAAQLLTESALLGLSGGACGLLLAFVAIRLLTSLVPADLWGGLLRQVPIGINGPVLAFTLLLSLSTGLLFGLAPALTAGQVDLTAPLKEGQQHRSGRARSILVMAEVALSVVLLVMAGLLLRSFVSLRAVDPGFHPEPVLTVAVGLSAEAYKTPGRRLRFFEEAARRLGSLPGARSTAFTDSIPLTGVNMILRGMEVEGREPLPPDQEPQIAIVGTSPGYFQTLGIPIVRGRAFTDAEIDAASPVAVVSRDMARRLWKDADPRGRRIRIGRRDAPWTTVIGVAGDVRHDGLEAEPRTLLYRPFALSPRTSGYLVIRAQGDPAALAAAARREVTSLDRSLLISDVSTMTQRLAGSIAARRFNLVLLGIFAGLALVLAAVGLYGVLGYIVAERTREIGVRMALGAQRRGVLALVIRQGVVLAAVGVGVGLPAAFAASRLLRSSLFGITAADPLTYVAIPLALLLVAFVSAWLPARRATRVDPVVALRQE